GFVYNAAGAHAEAEALLREVAATGDHGFQTTLGALYLALTLADKGALDEAASALAGLRPMLLARRNHATLGVLAWISSIVELRRGDLAAAEEDATEARRLLAASAFDHIWATAALSSVLLARGATPESLALARHAVEARRALPGPHLLDPCLWLAHV